MTFARIAFIAVLGPSSTVHAFTVTKTTTFNPGVLCNAASNDVRF